MREQLKALLKIAEEIRTEIRKYDTEDNPLPTSSIHIGNVKIYRDDNSWFNSFHPLYTIYFRTGTKSKAEIVVEHTVYGPEVEVYHYFYFNKPRIDKMVADNLNVVEELKKELERITTAVKQERIAELEKELSKLKP
jgi:hypothetical protein